MVKVAKKVKAEKPVRPPISRALEVSLCVQVDQTCPNCLRPLFKKKTVTKFKDYEIAHIYPLNPTLFELELLKEQERLGAKQISVHDLFFAAMQISRLKKYLS